jgi:hypothetical protein
MAYAEGLAHTNKALLFRRAVCVSRLRGQPPSEREAFRGAFEASESPKIDFCIDFLSAFFEKKAARWL